MPTTLISDSSHYTSVLDLAMNRHCRHQRPVCAAGENREAIPRGYGGTCFPMSARAICAGRPEVCRASPVLWNFVFECRRFRQFLSSLAEWCPAHGGQRGKGVRRRGCLWLQNPLTYCFSFLSPAFPRVAVSVPRFPLPIGQSFLRQHRVSPNA